LPWAGSMGMVALAETATNTDNSAGERVLAGLGFALGASTSAVPMAVAAKTDAKTGLHSIKVTSSIKESNALVSYAQKAGKSVQREIDHLTNYLHQGYFNAGKGAKYLFNGIYEARLGAARVYFTFTEKDVVNIVAKSNKGDQPRVLKLLRKL